MESSVAEDLEAIATSIWHVWNTRFAEAMGMMGTSNCHAGCEARQVR